MAYSLLAGALIGAEIYLAFFRHAVMVRTEGAMPAPIHEFGGGATVAHAFQMDGDTLHAISVRIVTNQPSSLRMMFKLLRLHDREPGAENDPNAYSEIYKWTDTLRARAGDHWHRIEFPSVGNADGEWHRFEIRLLDATSRSARGQSQSTPPTVSIIASEDNPPYGGKLWINGVRRPGSLVLQAYGGTMYEQFRFDERFLPVLLRSPAVPVALVLVYHLLFLTLSYKTLSGPPPPAFLRSPDGPLAAASTRREARLTAALGAGVFVALSGVFVAPGSPEDVIPLVPEGLLLAVLLVGSAAWVRRREASQHQWSISDSEWFLLTAVCSVLAFWTFPRVVGSLLSVTANPCWHAAPSSVTRSECFLQAAYGQNYGVRSFATLILALSVGAASAFWTRVGRRNWRPLAFAVVSVCVLHAVLGFVTLFSRGQQLVPKWIMVNSWGRDRFTFVMANPSMVWPQLAPGLAWLLWFALRGRGWKRTFPIAGAVILSAAIVSTRQRGGLLLLGLLWGAAGAMWIWPALSTRGVKRSARILGLSALLVASCAVAVSLMTWPRLMDGTFHDLSRLSIWNIALHAWLQHDPLWGFGYASWHSTFLKAVAGTKDMFLLRPTAHNLWVQLAFEHGLVGFFMITSLMLSIVAIVLRNVNLKPLERELVFLQLIAFLTCTLVQEVDFVRPVLVTFAVTWGTLLGLRPRYAGPTRGVYQESISVSSIRRTTLCWSVSGLAVCAFAMVLACSAWFAHGAFAFEPDSEVRDSLTRSVGKTATIPVFGPAKFWLFDTKLPRRQGSVAVANAAGSPFRLTVNQDENVYLPLTGGNRFRPKRHRLDISPALEEGRREISAQIVYPPRTAPDLLPLLLTKSASQPVQQGTKSWIECASTCAIALDAELLDGFVPALEMVGTGVHEVGAPVLWGIRFEDSSDVRLPALSFAELRFDFNGSLSNVDGARLILPNHYVRSTSTKWVLLVVHNPIQAGPPDNRVVRVSLMRD